MPMEKPVSFGYLPDGRAVLLHTLRNKNNVTLKVMNYGGIVVSLSVPDRNGVMEDVVLGYDTLDAYVKSNPFFGALIGRYGNRIAHGRFQIDDISYQLACNNGPNHLHGGDNGFHTVFWNAEPVAGHEGKALQLSYTSVDGEEGYPGTLEVKVIYTLTDDNEFIVSYQAVTDKATVVNLTQHSYFNLSGNCKRSLLEHKLSVRAKYFLPVDSTLIPTGERRAVGGTPFNFLQPVQVGNVVHDDDEQLRLGNGFDHCWILDEGKTAAATLYDEPSGRYLEVFTTEPGIQCYTGNFLDGTLTGKDGKMYNKFDGICLETQHFPDSPNRPEFPPVFLYPGQVYRSETAFRFGIR